MEQGEKKSIPNLTRKSYKNTPPYQSKVHGPGTDMLLQSVLHQKLVNCGCGHVKSKHSEQVLLHPKQLFLRVGVIRNVHKLVHFRRIHLLVFPNQKQAMRLRH